MTKDTHKTTRTVSERGKNDVIGVLQTSGSIWRGINNWDIDCNHF